MKNKPLSREKEIVVRELENEILIYDFREDKALCLNETSALIWQMCNGKRTVKEIGSEVNGKLGSTVSEDFIWLAIEQLKKNNLLENGRELPDKFEGMDRREVVRRIGLASFAALPLISAVIAPSAAQAASGCLAPGQVYNMFVCTNDTPTCNVIAGVNNCCSRRGATNPNVGCPNPGSTNPHGYCTCAPPVSSSF